jgi:hypothetical protein
MDHSKEETVSKVPNNAVRKRANPSIQRPFYPVLVPGYPLGPLTKRKQKNNQDAFANAAAG